MTHQKQPIPNVASRTAGREVSRPAADVDCDGDRNDGGGSGSDGSAKAEASETRYATRTMLANARLGVMMIR